MKEFELKRLDFRPSGGGVRFQGELRELQVGIMAQALWARAEGGICHVEPHLKTLILASL